MLFLPGIVCTILFLLNLIAQYYDTSNIIPFMVVFKMSCIYIFIACPLCVAGTVIGRNMAGKTNFPCRVNSIPRPIPEGALYTRPPIVILLTGILPFGSIFIEMYFMFASFWHYK